MISFEGKNFDARTVDMIKRVRWLTGLKLSITQGSYNTSVDASAGTHSGGGAVDFSVSGLSAASKDKVVLVARQLGFAAWHRLPSQGPWGEHIHGIAINCPDLAVAAERQVVAYQGGRNGLANNGPDDGPSGYRQMTWERYNAAHPDEEWEMSVGDDILNAVNNLAGAETARAQLDSKRETVYANRYTDETGRIDSVGKAVADLAAKVDALTTKVDALAAAPKA